MKETSGHTEVSVKMLQTGGQSEQLAFTGPDATAIVERLKQLPAFVHAHAGGLQAELASYDTIPIPVPDVQARGPLARGSRRDQDPCDDGGRIVSACASKYGPNGPELARCPETGLLHSPDVEAVTVASRLIVCCR